MKILLSMVAALTLAGQAPALAFSTAHPEIVLVSLNPTHVAAVEARPDCYAPAAIDGTPFFQMPTIAADMGVSGITQVKIDLTSAGKLAAASVYGTSGNKWLDQAALQSARMTSFTAEKVNCERVAGSYLYDVSF